MSFLHNLNWLLLIFFLKFWSSAPIWKFESIFSKVLKQIVFLELKKISLLINSWSRNNPTTSSASEGAVVSDDPVGVKCTVNVWQAVPHSLNKGDGASSASMTHHLLIPRCIHARVFLCWNLAGHTWHYAWYIEKYTWVSPWCCHVAEFAKKVDEAESKACADVATDVVNLRPNTDVLSDVACWRGKVIRFRWSCRWCGRVDMALSRSAEVA